MLLVAPVALLSEALQDEFLQIPSFLFAVVVLLFSLGPRDLDDEVEDYADALSTGDLATQQRVAGELLEGPPPELPAERNEAIERAIYVQANNRISVWCLVPRPGADGRLGISRPGSAPPPGGTEGRGRGRDAAMEAVRTLHGLLAFLPSRLLALGYALAGNFEEAVASWRNAGRETILPFADGTVEVVARIRIAASGTRGTRCRRCGRGARPDPRHPALVMRSSG